MRAASLPRATRASALVGGGGGGGVGGGGGGGSGGGGGGDGEGGGDRGGHPLGHRVASRFTPAGAPNPTVRDGRDHHTTRSALSARSLGCLASSPLTCVLRLSAQRGSPSPDRSCCQVPHLSARDRRDRRGPAARAGAPRVGERLGPMPGSHGNTRDSKLDTTPDVQARLTAGGGQGPRVTGRNLARLSREAYTFRLDYHPACYFPVSSLCVRRERV